MTIPYTDDDDTPAEAEERYWVGDGESDNKVYERGRAHIYRTIQRAVTAEAERDEARAEVERLTALVREVAAAGVATTNRKYVEVQVDVDTWADLRAEIGEPPADGHYPVGARPAAPSGERLRPHQFWVDGNLYNGDVIIKEWRAYQRAAERREPGNGARPAAPTVTASDIAVAVETAAIAPGRTWSTPVGGFDGLAEQGGEG